MVQTPASEEGTSHLTDDGWSETQRKVDVIGTPLIDLGIAVDASQSRVVSDVVANCVVQDVAPNLCIRVDQ